MTNAWSSEVAHLRTWIGRQETADDIVTPELVRRFRAAFDLASGPLTVGVAAA